MPLYTSLREGSVRLLRLLPHSDENSGIECQLITCPLLDSGRTHPYEALSYVWGPVENQQSIYVDGDKLSVGANLHAALSHLRDCFLERILWIDAICINQKDEKGEKEQQVQSMAKIYAKASRVIVWLGEAAADSDLALKEILRAANQLHINSVMDETNQQVASALSDQHPADSSTNESNRHALLALLERPWFQRIWVSGRQSTIWQK
jgi:hypothetical protein